MRKARIGLGLWLNWSRTCLAGVEPWVQSLALHKPSVEAHACNPNIQEVNLGKLGVQGHFQGSNTDRQAWWQSPLLKSGVLFSIVHADIDFYEHLFLGGGFSSFSKGSQSSRWSRLCLCLLMIWDGWLTGGSITSDLSMSLSPSQ